MTTFSIDVPLLSQGLLDRSEDLRGPGRVAAAWPRAKVLAVGPSGEFPVVSDGVRARLAVRDSPAWGDRPPPGAMLLGALDGIYYWAVRSADEQRTEPGPRGTAARPADLPAVPATVATIRTAGPLLSDNEAALATTAVALAGWHASSLFCATCGQPTVPDPTGHSRSCPAGHQEFPRTDPAVIVLVHDDSGNAVLARQPSWAPGRFSVLAGFAEVGESLEATVAREVGEEVGVAVDQVQYLGSQPWPFPRSLMIAFAARAPRRAALRPRPGEIDEARWFSRRELADLLSRQGERADRTADGITLPGSISIARRMVEGFVRGG